MNLNRFMGTRPKKFGESLKLRHLHVAYIIIIFLLFSNYYSYHLITTNTARKCIFSIFPNSASQTERHLFEVRNKGKGKIAPSTGTPKIAIINKQQTDTEKLVKIFNQFGNTSRFSVIDEFALALEASGIAEQNSFPVLDYMSLVNALIAGKRVPTLTLVDTIAKPNGNQTNKFRIILGVIACGRIHTKEAAVMLKSAALFSQDAALHIVAFSDDESILNVAQDLLELKWTGQVLGWEISFEIYLDWFPPKKQGTEWKQMYKLCASERLFFPTLLPHIDSLIYVDVDVIVVSNLTKFWMNFPRIMGKDHIAAAAQNNEPTAAGSGWYPYQSINKTIPYFGVKGLNAGVMLMNLTRMREFNFEKKAIATHELYKEKIQLADQDILNILFAGFPEKAATIDCSLNFNWVHCRNRKNNCDRNKTGGNDCFCTAVLQNGVQIVHGNGGTFKKVNYDGHKFFPLLYSSFQKLDLLIDSPSLIFEKLTKQFNDLDPKPCYPLTGELLYGNAAAYFHSLSAQ